MPAGLPVAIALLLADPASAQSYGPPAPTPPRPRPAETRAGEGCTTQTPKADTREIVVCAERPQGYRLDPDVIEAKREMRTGRRKPPERFVDKTCATIGPMGCRFEPGVNLVDAALTLATMVDRAVKGENVGRMFITDPQPDEYQLYLEARHRREGRAMQAVKRRADDAPLASD
jgi:hypothetical protein